MRPCPSCSQENPNTANFCLQCGQALGSPSLETATETNAEGLGTRNSPTQSQLWETFIGPSKSIQFSVKTGWLWRSAFLYYKEKFEKIETVACISEANKLANIANVVDPNHSSFSAYCK